MGKLKGVIQFTGKLGQVVGYKGRNERRFIRERVTEINNPRSTGQNIQRMILATAAVGVSKLKSILSNSFEGKQYGADSLAYARQLWMRQLRTSNIMSSTLNFIKKGEQRFAINPYQLSRGSLNAPAIGFVSDSENDFYVRGSKNEQDNEGTASQCFPNVPVGRQWTIIAIAEKGAPMVAYCRFAFKNDTEPAFIQGTGGYLLNPDAIDLAKAEGRWDKLSFNDANVGGENVITIDASDMLLAEGNDDLDMTAAAGLIISDKEGGLRSTSSLVVNPMYTAHEFSASVAAPTFGNVATEVNIASDVYLDNSTTEEQSATAAATCEPALPSNVANGGSEDFVVTLPVNGAIQYGSIVYENNSNHEESTLLVDGTGGGSIEAVSCSIESASNVHTISVSTASFAITIKSINVVVDGVAYSV